MVTHLDIVTDPPQRDGGTETSDTGADDTNLEPIARGSGVVGVHGVRSLNLFRGRYEGWVEDRQMKYQGVQGTNEA